ncbi:MAG: hypothetical protein ACE5EH_03100 [Gammaproteobacteria bacterium]
MIDSSMRMGCRLSIIMLEISRDGDERHKVWKMGLNDPFVFNMIDEGKITDARLNCVLGL